MFFEMILSSLIKHWLLAMDWMFTSSQSQMLKAKIPNVMEFGGGVFWGQLVLRVEPSWMRLVPF